ncbi:hypothetical protein AB0M43_37130 [Longispora sp. NPDC051575]|uniref:hypothetical protein n=1 Tax=Longispora sp. NPDC051575 TaxID=3154943 RepID=UPI00341EAF3C
MRLLNSLEHGQESIKAIEAILEDLDAVPVARHLIAGVSAARTVYQMPNGRKIIVKQLRPTRLPTTCVGCSYNNGVDCHEGFYGVRLYLDTTGVFQVGVCIQRMDLCVPLEEFVTGDLCREVLALRADEYRQLSAQHAR